jgi:hypothetical protein
MASADRVSQLKHSTQQQQLGVEEQLSLVKFLRHAVQYKDEQIAVLQAELATIKSAADAQRESVEAEKQGELEEAQHQLMLSELERQRMEGELHAFRALEPEVGSLREEVDELQQTLGRERREHDAQLRRLGDDYQQYRGALQEQFSVMVHSNGLVDLSAKSADPGDGDSDGNSEGMVSEAMRAAQAYAEERIEQLGTELLAAQRAGDAAMNRHSELQSALSKLKLDYDVQAESLREQTRNAVRYKKKLAAATAKLERFEKQAEKSSSRPSSGSTLNAGSSVHDENSNSAISPALNGLPARRTSASSTRSASSIGSAGSRGSRGGSRVRSAGSVGSSSRPVSRAGSELSEYLEKRRLRAQLEDDAALAQTALGAGVDMSAWAEAAVQGGSPPGAAPPLTGVWSSNPDPAEEEEDYYGGGGGGGGENVVSDLPPPPPPFETGLGGSPVESLRSESSLKSLESESSAGGGGGGGGGGGVGGRGQRSGGPHRSFRHALLTESRPSSSLAGQSRFLAP